MAELPRRPHSRVIESSSSDNATEALQQSPMEAQTLKSSAAGTVLSQLADKQGERHYQSHGQEAPPLRFSTTSSAKRTRLSVKKKQMLSPEAAEKRAYELIEEMKRIYTADEAAASAGAAALGRTDNADRVCAQILRRDMQEQCIRLGALSELRRWLEPLSNNCLPSQAVKTALLSLLANLPVTRADLASSGIGRIVHFYSKNGREAKNVRRQAEALVKRWKAMVVRSEQEE